MFCVAVFVFSNEINANTILEYISWENLPSSFVKSKKVCACLSASRSFCKNQGCFLYVLSTWRYQLYIIRTARTKTLSVLQAYFEVTIPILLAEFLIHKMFPKNENGEVKYATEIVLQRLNSKISALNDHPSTLLKNRIIVNRFCVWWLLNVKLENRLLICLFQCMQTKNQLKIPKGGASNAFRIPGWFLFCNAF